MKAVNGSDQFSDAAVIRTIKIVQAGRDAAARLCEDDTNGTLSRLDRTHLRRTVRKGETELGNFILRNRGLAVTAARKFMSPDNSHFDDLVALLIVEMVQALPKWDISRGRFSTFIRLWLQQACQRSGMLTAAGIHVPSQTLTEQRSVGREYLTENREDLARLADAASHAASLDAPLGPEDGGFTLMDTLAADGDGATTPYAAQQIGADHPWLRGLDDEGVRLCLELVAGGTTSTFGPGGVEAKRRVRAHLSVSTPEYAMVG